MATRVQRGTYSFEEAREILGECHLDQVPQYKVVYKPYKNYGYGYDWTPWDPKVVEDLERVWMAKGGRYVGAK